MHTLPPYTQSVIIDVRSGLLAIKELYEKIDVYDRSLDNLIRDIIVNISIDAEASQGIQTLQELMQVSTCFINPNDRDLVIQIIDILGKYLLFWFRHHRFYNELGELSHQFHRWVEPGVMLLLPVKNINAVQYNRKLYSFNTQY